MYFLRNLYIIYGMYYQLQNFFPVSLSILYQLHQFVCFGGFVRFIIMFEIVIYQSVVLYVCDLCVHSFDCWITTIVALTYYLCFGCWTNFLSLCLVWQLFYLFSPVKMYEFFWWIFYLELQGIYNFLKKHTFQTCYKTNYI